MKEKPTTFTDELREARKVTRPLNRLDIDLSLAETDRKYNLAGNMFYIFHAPDNLVYVDVRFNEQGNPAHRLSWMLGLRTYFERVFITTPAGQAGTLTIIYGHESPQLPAIIDNRSATLMNLDAIRDELRGDTTPKNWGTEITVGSAAAVQVLAANADRKGMSCQGKSTNTGIIYVGFDDTVTSSKWVGELQAGVPFGVDDYRGPLFARASAAGQLLGWGEW